MVLTHLITDASRYSICSLTRYWSESNSDDRMILMGNGTDIDNFWRSKSDSNNVTFIQGKICSSHQLEVLLLHEKASNLIVAPPADIPPDHIGQYLRLIMQAVQKCWLLRNDPVPYRMHLLLQSHMLWDPKQHELETKVMEWAQSYGINLSISIMPALYGPWQESSKRVPSLIKAALYGNRQPLYGDGSQVEEILHASDMAYAIRQIMKRDEPYQIYKISGEETQSLTLLSTLYALLDQAFSNDDRLAQLFPSSPMARGQSALSLITLVQDRRLQARPLLHNSHYEDIWPHVKQPRHKLEDGLREVVNFYIEHLDEVSIGESGADIQKQAKNRSWSAA